MKKSVILAGMAVLVLAACNKTPKTEPQPVDFSQYAVRVEPVITRATETNFEKGDQIGLSIVRAAGDYASNKQLTYDGTAFSGDLNWYDEGAEESTLKAYYPYNSTESLPTRLPDLLELECDVIFISYSHYDDDFTVYDLTEFRTFRESYDLIKQFYPFDENDPDVKFKMHRLALITDKYPFSLELCARSMKRGTDTPDTCADALVGGIKNMKARIPANKDRKPKTDTHYRHIESLFRKADLTVTDKYVLSYMRFMPESGVPKMLFQKLTRLIDFTEIDKLIDLGFIHDNSDGTISISSIVRKLVEADYKINPEEMLAFGETLFSTDTSEAPKEVLAEIADRISPLKYLTMIESDIFVAYHLLFQFYFKIESNFSTDMAMSCLAMNYNKNIFKHRLLYQADKAQFFERFKDSENFDLIKQTLEKTETNPRWHAHEDGKEPPSDPLIRSFIVSEEDDAEIFGLNDE